METNNLGTIRIYSSSDAGCDWTDAEKEDFCQCVVDHLSGLYPGVEVECEITDSTPTRVFVYGKERRAGLVTHPEPERDLIETIRAALQDVWERGDFWAPFERASWTGGDNG